MISYIFFCKINCNLLFKWKRMFSLPVDFIASPFKKISHFKWVVVLELYKKKNTTLLYAKKKRKRFYLGVFIFLFFPFFPINAFVISFFFKKICISKTSSLVFSSSGTEKSGRGRMHLNHRPCQKEIGS